MNSVKTITFNQVKGYTYEDRHHFLNYNTYTS